MGGVGLSFSDLRDLSSNFLCEIPSEKSCCGISAEKTCFCSEDCKTVGEPYSDWKLISFESSIVLTEKENLPLKEDITINKFILPL